MLAPIDFVLLAAFVAWCAFSGLRNRRAASRGLEDYFLAGRTLPGWKAGLSMAATQFAADTPLLVTGLVAVSGIFALWRLWIYALAFLLMGFVLAGAWRRASVLTDAELAELRYGGRLALPLRVAKALYFGVVFNSAVVAMVLLAATRVAEPFLPWHEWLPPALFEPVVGLVRAADLVLTASPDPALVPELSAANLISLGAIVALTLLYSTTGGLRAVVDTDIAQLVIALLATAFYAVVVVDRAGGLGALPARLAELYGAAGASELLAFTPSRARDVGAVVLGTIAIQWIAQMNADGTGYLAQRTMACRSDRDARHAAIVFVVTQILLRSLLWIPIAIGLLVLIPIGGEATGTALVARREATFVEGIARWLPPGVQGLMLIGMLAALASTVDTHLNWGASYWTNDLYRRLVCGAWLRREPTQRALVWVARLSNLVTIGLSFAVLLRLGSIQTAWKVTLLLGAGMGLPLVLRWVWWRLTAASELGAILASLVLAPVLLATVEEEGVRLLAMAGSTALVAIAIAYLGGPEPAARLEAFYRRVRPPGLWGPVARRCGEPPDAARRRLGVGLVQTGAGAFAVFCLLVAIGTALFGSPAPTWLPSRAAWIGALLFGGLAAGALVWRLERNLGEAPAAPAGAPDGEAAPLSAARRRAGPPSS